MIDVFISRCLLPSSSRRKYRSQTLRLSQGLGSWVTFSQSNTHHGSSGPTKTGTTESIRRSAKWLPSLAHRVPTKGEYIFSVCSCSCACDVTATLSLPSVPSWWCDVRLRPWAWAFYYTATSFAFNLRLDSQKAYEQQRHPSPAFWHCPSLAASVIPWY